jgi:hypothetical protein
MYLSPLTIIQKLLLFVGLFPLFPARVYKSFLTGSFVQEKANGKQKRELKAINNCRAYKA